MRKLALAFIACFALATSAAAGIPVGFGDDEKIEKIADIDLLIERNEPLCIAQKVRTSWFILPYKVSAELVIAPRGSSREYYDLPYGEELREYQDRGLLPKPLPKPSISTIDYIFGYSLWIAIAVLALSLISSFRGSKANKNSAQNAEATQTQDAAQDQNFAQNEPPKPA